MSAQNSRKDAMILQSLLQDYKQEFSAYSKTKLLQDFLAGLTVAAVALPLALAFGVASGATAAIGLMSSIFAALLTSPLAGAPYQVSGPTAGTVALLAMVAEKNGLPGIWICALLAGVFLILAGLLRLGKWIKLLPGAVITGFSSAVSVVLIIGQLDSFLGIRSAAASSSWGKLINVLQSNLQPSWQAIVTALLVILVIFLWPQKWNSRIPGTLVGLISATVLLIITKWDILQIGNIPQTVRLEQHLGLQMILAAPWKDLILPSFSLAFLIGMEALLCGSVMSTISPHPYKPDKDLISQGIGNAVMPWLGGIPVTATMIRSNVMLRSGGQTRLAGLFKGLSLLLIMLVLAPWISRIPMAALAGVIMATAWKMNKWSILVDYGKSRHWPNILAVITTVLVTLWTDLVIGLLAGVAAYFIIKKIFPAPNPTK